MPLHNLPPVEILINSMPPDAAEPCGLLTAVTTFLAITKWPISRLACYEIPAKSSTILVALQGTPDATPSHHPGQWVEMVRMAARSAAAAKPVKYQ
jgi:hypothetical protein